MYIVQSDFKMYFYNVQISNVQPVTSIYIDSVSLEADWLRITNYQIYKDVMPQ